MNKKVIIASLIYSIPCAVISGLYMIAPSPINSFLWCMFIGFFTTNALGPNFNKLGGYIISVVIGLLWALLYKYAIDFFILNLQTPLFLSVILGIFIVTVLFSIVHFGYLYSWKYNFPPMIFPSVASFFAVQQNIMSIPIIGFSLLIGILCAISSMSLWNMVFNANNKTTK